MPFIQTSTPPSRLQKTFTKRILANGILPLLNLEKGNSYFDFDIKKENNDQNDDVQYDNERIISPNNSLLSREPTPHYSQQDSISIPYAPTHLRVSPPSPPPCDRNISNFLSAFGVLKSVPNPPDETFLGKWDSFFERNYKKRLILFNPPPPKIIILNEQYHINKSKFGGKRINKNDFNIVPTPSTPCFNNVFIRKDNKYSDDENIEMYDSEECVYDTV